MEFALVTNFTSHTRGWPPSDGHEYHHPPLFLIPPALCYSDLHTDRMKRKQREIARLQSAFLLVFEGCKYSRWSFFLDSYKLHALWVWGLRRNGLGVDCKSPLILRSDDFFVPKLSLGEFLLGCMGMLLL
jgi:hypothetical protein